MKNPFAPTLNKLSLTVLAVSLSVIYSASAATEHWLGAGSDQNWTTAANWSSPQQSYYNDVDFYDFGGSSGLTDFSVNSIFNANTGVAQTPLYQLRMYPTNRNFNIQINSGQTLATGAGTGDLWAGGDTITSSRGVANLQETILFSGPGTLSIGGTLHVGQGLTNGVQTVPPSTNFVTLNMSGLNTFSMNPSAPGGGTAASRLLLCGQIQHYSQGAIYLAKTNNILLGNDLEIGAMSTYSNSMPCPLYLGMVNSILVGNNGSANGLVTIGSRGNTNAFIAFNPAFLGTATPPSAAFASPAAINGGRVTTFYVCRSDGGSIPAYGHADLNGGNVSVMASTMHLGYAGGAGLNALGVLTFDNGIVNVNNVNVGNQTVTSGGAGVGIINLNTNSTYGTNATLQVNNTLTLGAVTGTLTAGTAGTLNINGGQLVANIITNGGGAAAVNMTNGTWNISVTNTGITNMTLTSFNGGGATNIINITFITPLLGSSFPIRFHLISAPSLAGASTLGLGPLPASYDPSHPYAGYLDTTTTPGLVDFVLTAGPSSARILTWSGLNGGNPDGDWDVATTLDWLTNAVPTFYNQFDLVNFNDITSPAQTNVNLTTTLTPYSITVNNTASLYTFAGGGNFSGVASMTKQGTGTLILDNSTPNNFTGGVTISGGILQVGTNDTGGNLPAGVPIVDNAVLAVDRTDNVTIGNIISGSGAVVSAGGGTLQLAAANTFTGSAIATNNSTLQGGVTGAFGAGSGTVVIANGSTLDPDGVGTTKGVTVSGAGAGGAGAVVNSGGAIFDSSGGLTPTLTLAGNTTLSYPNRWDLGGAGSTTATLSTGGQPYNLTLNGSGGYFEWRNVVADAKLGDIYLQAGTFGYVGSTSAGNPANSLVISNFTTLEFYAGTVNATINKQVVLQDEGNIQNGTGANTISGPVVLTNVNSSQYCTFKVGGTSLTLSSNLSGNGILDMEVGTGTLIMNGNGSALTGGANIASGTFVLNGTIGSGVTNFSGTALAGSGTVNGYVDVSGAFYPGGSNTAGTFTANGGLSLESSATLTMDLKSTTGVGASSNDLIAITGNLTAYGNTILINPIASTLANGTYTLITYTGSLNGTGFAGAQTVAASRYILTVSTSTPGQVQLIVTGNPNNLVWNNGADNGLWDVQGSYNWTNLTKNIEDQFYTSDSVTFDDSITSAANPTTSISIPSGVIVYPSVITNNSATNYTISGPGNISGGASITKLGTSTLTITATNSFTGNTAILAGTLKAGPNNSLGATNGTVYVTNGATLDLDYSLGLKPLVLSGSGVGGIGALVNNDTNVIPVYDSPGGLRSVTLAGNATLGGSYRLDFGQVSPSSGTVSSGGSNFNLTIIGTAYREWANVAFDANFGNINVMTTNGGSIGIKGNTTLGNPTNALAVFSNATVTLYADTTNVTVNKNMMLYGGSTNQNGTGTNGILSPITLGVASGDVCTFNVAGTSLSVSNVISGPGTLVKIGSSPLYLFATNTYTGSTVVTGGPLSLTNNGSISASTNISVASSQVLDVSGRSDKTLNLVSGQTLQGSGTISGNLTAVSGSIVMPGIAGTGTLTVTNTVNLGGTTALSVGATVTNVLSGAIINYGGTLQLSLVGSFAAGNSFKLFNSTKTNYSGNFTSISPATPGAGLEWNTSLLNVNGTLAVRLVPQPATFSSWIVSGSSLTFSGTGGASNGPYQVFTSTNIGLPVTNWTQVGSGNFSGTGNFSFTTTNTNNASQFYILKEQ